MTELGRKIGPYQLEAVIGTGSFAAVHRATDERLEDTVALKVLADNHALNPEMRQRFITEGQVLRRIDSPHVVRVLDIGETEQHQPYLVLEHADRGTLDQRVRKLREDGWTPTPWDLLRVVRALAAAVEAIHGAAVVHRDLSPGNVLLRSTLAPQNSSGHRGQGDGSGLLAADERLMLADLGLCKDLARNSGFTQAAGTDGFRPPEQRAGPARVDARADLWALTALLVWLATGTAPDDRSARTLLEGTDLPDRLGVALDTSLAPDPTRRHPDVATWLAEVEAALLPTPATLESGSSPTNGTLRSRPDRSPARWVAVAGLAAGALLGGGAAITFGAGDSSPRGELERLEDGSVEVVSERGTASLAITGPVEVAVDDVAELSAETTDVDRWVWFLPDGQVIFNTETVQMRATSTGTSRISLLGVNDEDERLVVEHDLRVTNS